METIDEEEIKEHLEEEMAKFEDAGYFKRLFKMFVGFGRTLLALDQNTADTGIDDVEQKRPLHIILADDRDEREQKSPHV